MSVRIVERELRSIKSTAEEIFGTDCEVYIFGSRVDLTKRGDIDIYIKTKLKNQIVLRKAQFLAKLKSQIGDQKIDLVVEEIENSESYPIYDVARERGIKI